MFGLALLLLPLLLSSFPTSIFAAPKEDKVHSLPDYGIPAKSMYSGFLDATEGTYLHYWFAEGPSPEAPVVLWLNGGPGSSSILGFLQEMGPILMNNTGGIMNNPYAWTNRAHLIALESPAGVGYSYCPTYPICDNTDTSTAKDARRALQDFFKKFPELAKNEFFITGESYAGVYVPTLAQEILQNAPDIRLVGIAAGDPCTDTDFQKESMNMLWYAHKHGLVPDDDFDFLWNKCGDSVRQSTKKFITKGRWIRENGRWADELLADASAPPSTECTLAQRKYLLTTSKGIAQGWDGAYINELDFYADAAALDWDLPGTLNYFQSQYLRRDDVKKALHVESAPSASHPWPGPPDGWTYTSEYNACNDRPSINESMVDIYRRIAPKLEKGAYVFNGDTDPCVSYEGTRNAIEAVGFPVLEGGAYRPWFYNKTATTFELLTEKPNLFGPTLDVHPGGAQFGGQIVNYENGLSFLTVHGSGHMVPQFQPQAADRGALTCPNCSSTNRSCSSPSHDHRPV